MNKTILIIEDNRKIINFLSTTLDGTEYTYFIAETGNEALKVLKEKSPKMIILDLGLPDIDGIVLIKTIRAFYKNPILILSARSEDKDKVIALDLGADDYLTKPFSVDELLARIRVFFRRLSQNNTSEESDIFTNSDLKIIFSSKEVFLNNIPIHLTPIEFNLLVLLAKNIGKVLTHNFILKEIWGDVFESDMLSLRVFMAGLRKKLKKIDPETQYIQTHVGVGYKMMKI